VNVVYTSDSVNLDYFALTVEVNIDQLDPAKAMSQLQEFLEVKWTVVYDGSTTTFKQQIMDTDVTSAYFVSQQAKGEGRTLPKCSPTLALIYKRLVHEHFKPVLISNTFFCRLIEFEGEEVEILYNDSVLYIKKWNAYFCSLEFVISRKADGRSIIKVCMEDLPFRQMESIDARMNSTSTFLPSVWLCFLLLYVIC